MKLYTVELTTPKLEHVVTIDVEAGSFGGAEREARKLYDWAKPVTVKAVRLGYCSENHRQWTNWHYDGF